MTGQTSEYLSSGNLGLIKETYSKDELRQYIILSRYCRYNRGAPCGKSHTPTTAKSQYPPSAVVIVYRQGTQRRRPDLSQNRKLLRNFYDDNSVKLLR